MNLPQKRGRRFSVYTGVVFVFLFFLDNRRVRESEPARSNERVRAGRTFAGREQNRGSVKKMVRFTFYCILGAML